MNVSVFSVHLIAYWFFKMYFIFLYLCQVRSQRRHVERKNNQSDTSMETEPGPSEPSEPSEELWSSQCRVLLSDVMNINITAAACLTEVKVWGCKHGGAAEMKRCSRWQCGPEGPAEIDPNTQSRANVEQPAVLLNIM